MEGPTLFSQTDRCDVMLIPRQRSGDTASAVDLAAQRRWYSMREVAVMLGYGLSKMKMLVITGELRSIKDGKPVASGDEDGLVRLDDAAPRHLRDRNSPPPCRASSYQGEGRHGLAGPWPDLHDRARYAEARVRRITVHDARRTCGSLLADLDVHPRVARQILRHAQFAIRVEIYTEVSPQATQDALKRLGESLL